MKEGRYVAKKKKDDGAYLDDEWLLQNQWQIFRGNSAEDVAAKEVYFLLFLCVVSETAPQTNDHSFNNSCWVIYII